MDKPMLSKGSAVDFPLVIALWTSLSEGKMMPFATSIKEKSGLRLALGWLHEWISSFPLNPCTIPKYQQLPKFQ